MMSRRLVMSTLNITALTALLITIAVYFYVQPRIQAAPESYSKTILQDNSPEELLEARPWLVVYQLNPSPVFSNNQQRLALDSQQVDMKLPKDEAKRIKAILQALRERMLLNTSLNSGIDPNLVGNVNGTNQSFWPEALGIPEVFLSDLGSGKDTVILDFPLEGDVQVNIHQEEALRASILETLNRNNINNNLWLINSEAQPIFLRHIALQTDLQ